jgi:hypothetical protein
MKTFKELTEANKVVYHTADEVLKFMKANNLKFAAQYYTKTGQIKKSWVNTVEFNNDKIGGHNGDISVDGVQDEKEIVKLFSKQFPDYKFTFWSHMTPETDPLQDTSVTMLKYKRK